MLVHFLKPFEEATGALEGDSTPTIQHVYLWYKKLIGCMQAPPNAIPIVKFLLKHRSEAITCKFEITSIHKLALFFHPKFKSSQPFSAAEKDEIFVLAKSLWDLAPAESDQNDLRQDHSYIFDLATISGCPPKKK